MEDYKKNTRQAFKEYTDGYDSTNKKIWLKIEHTYHVAENALAIAESLKLERADQCLAWLLGMTHDIGRFEQLTRYGTFLDMESIDHAELGADILFKDGLIERFCSDLLPQDWEALTETAIRLHNKLTLPEELDDRTLLFCNLIRDADKVDIFRVIVEIPYEDRANTKRPPIRECAREEVMQCVREHRCVPRILERSRLEALISQCCMAFEIIFDKSREMVIEQGYLDRMLTDPTHIYGDKERGQLDFVRSEIRRAWDMEL